MGAETARQAVRAGYRVVLGARREELLVALSEELGGRKRALPVRCDVSRWEDVEALAAEGLEVFGRIDAVFANAGVGIYPGFTNEPVEHWQHAFATNVLGVAYAIRATLPHLLERGTGHYLLMGSTSGRRVTPGSLYAPAKFAVTAMADSLRQELRLVHGNTAIRVTLFQPGFVDTTYYRVKPDLAAPGLEGITTEQMAGIVLWALTQPDNVDVNEIVVRPAGQPQ